jgi:DNA invertase Pin-like site-specific DNA recombinase
MCRVFLYSRISTDQQSLAQQERTVYEWLGRNNMSVTDVVSDEGISGGVSYKERKLGKELLPIMIAGDMLIVSEISRLGRSMFDLSKLINEELKPRKIRLVVVSMGLDLRCDHITALDELILQNFSFAAQLEKELISSRTRSALEVKKKQGIKMGAASDIYKSNKSKKSKEQIGKEIMLRGRMKNKRHMESKEAQMFLKALKKAFPEYCEDEDFTKWDWELGLRLRCGKLEKLVEVMKDIHDVDQTVFAKWQFDSPLLARRLRAHMQQFKKSVKNYSSNN